MRVLGAVKRMAAMVAGCAALLLELAAAPRLSIQRLQVQCRDLSMSVFVGAATPGMCGHTGWSAVY
jgi:hypothetical protein